MLLEKIELEPGEDVLKTVRKHWFVIVTELFGIFAMLILPLFILFLFAVFSDKFLNFNISLSHYTTLTVFVIATWSVITLMAGFTIWTHYYLDLWIITDRRIIVVDQIHFFNRNVSIFRLERLQDIEFTIHGLIPTLLNFGTLQARTAGAGDSNFKSSGLPDPRELQAIIQKAMDARLAELSRGPISHLID
jgi:hypothetical protein